MSIARGLNALPAIYAHMGATDFIAGRFKPAGIMPFLREDSKWLSNQIIALDTIIGHHANDLQGRLFDAATPQQAMQVVLLWLARSWHIPDHYAAIQFAQNCIVSTVGNISVTGLADDIGMSQRHFERLFAQYVGFTPKLYARMVRFEHLMQRIYAGNISADAASIDRRLLHY